MTERAREPLAEVMPGHWSTAEGRAMAAEYLAKSRDDLCMGEMTDTELANRQYLAGRDDLSLTHFQTAAKERIRWLSAQLAALSGIEDARESLTGWQPIETAPEGNEREGPFFDVAWAGEQHLYLPVGQRAIDCYREGGTVKLKHGFPSVTTVFGTQPTHWRPSPPPPLCESASSKIGGDHG